jgi:hypothetical protein
MVIFLTVVVFVFVLSAVAIVLWSLYECTPLPKRHNPYRDESGRRRWDSPKVDDLHGRSD